MIFLTKFAETSIIHHLQNNTMRHHLFFILLALMTTTAGTATAQKSDPVRDQLKWDRPAAPSNDEGEITAIYLGYTRPDGKHFDLTSPLSFPIQAEQFMGGDIYEKDINFDGIADLQISLGHINGYGTEIFDAWTWDATSHQFVHVEGYSDIPGPKIDSANRRIMSYDRKDNVVDVAEYRWKDGKLNVTHRHTETAERDTPAQADELLMQAKALVGEWWWAEDGQLPSEIQLILSLDIEDGVLYCNEATIYGSTASFDLNCTYINGVLTITDASAQADGLSSLNAQLKLNERGDLYGTFDCTVGEHHSKGTVTLRMK